jgi:hypothetical protein
MIVSSDTFSRLFAPRWGALFVLVPLLSTGCTDDTITPNDTPEAGASACAESGAAPAAAPDDHCRGGEDGAVLGHLATACAAEPGDAAADDPDAAPPEPDVEVPPHEGLEADDDDCKFHVKFVPDCLAQNRDVTFTMTPTNITDGTVVTGADPYIEATLDGLPPPNTTRKTTEANGVYTIPARFDRPGRWMVRVHLFGMCVDSENSKHAHVGFYVDVP